MKPILLPDDMTIFRLPAGQNERFPQSEGAYPIQRFAVEHEVSAALFADKAALATAVCAIHDEHMDQKGATRVSEITIHEQPSDGQRAGKLGADHRYVTTISRGIDCKLVPVEH
jgi:hypothetical protein